MSKKKKADEFPLTVKSGSSSVKIYRDEREGGRTYFRVVYYLGGKRHRLVFNDLDDAKNEATAKAAQLARGDVDAMQLTGKDRLTYGRALDAVKVWNVPLDAAAIEYSEARKVLKSHSLIDAARFYMRHHGQGITGKLVSDAYEEFKKSKTDANRSAVYLRDIAYRVGGFSKAFHVEVRELSPQDVADYLAALKVEARSFNNTILLLKTFFGFCQSRNWLSKDVNLLSLVERKSGSKGAIEIFTPKELRAILEKSKNRVATCIAIQAFAGVRTAELFRLTWDDLKRRGGHIEVAAAKAKTQARRLVPISTNLAAWLKRGKKEGESNRVWPVAESEYYEQLALIAKAAGVKWQVNALRHSFISYRVAESKDMAATALEAGNSPKVIFQNYRELVTPAEAKEWFGIMPPKQAKNIIEMEAA